MAEKGGHKHFMHKEIHEQPRAVADTLRGRVLLERGRRLLRRLVPVAGPGARPGRRVTILACGTCWHAALVGKAMVESLARLPVEVDLASEFRYRDPLVGAEHLVLAVSQSGETAGHAGRAAGGEVAAAPSPWPSATSWAAPSRARHTPACYTNAGPEIGVASTKAFTTQLAALFLLAVKLGRLRGQLGVAEAQDHLTHLVEVAKHLEEVLHVEPEVKRIARLFQGAQDFLFLGRGPMYPVALEGALKLKEISYIHAEGYAGGEMKHGPIALIDERHAGGGAGPQGPAAAVRENARQRRRGPRPGQARSSPWWTRTTTPWTRWPTRCCASRPRRALLSPLVACVPLQLLAYHVADLRGNDVDQPRNLAKSVTVE